MHVEELGKFVVAEQNKHKQHVDQELEEVVVSAVVVDALVIDLVEIQPELYLDELIELRLE